MFTFLPSFFPSMQVWDFQLQKSRDCHEPRVVTFDGLEVPKLFQDEHNMKYSTIGDDIDILSRNVSHFFLLNGFLFLPCAFLSLMYCELPILCHRIETSSLVLLQIYSYWHVQEVIVCYLSLFIKWESLDCKCWYECDEMVLNGWC